MTSIHSVTQRSRLAVSPATHLSVSEDAPGAAELLEPFIGLQQTQGPGGAGAVISAGLAHVHAHVVDDAEAREAVVAAQLVHGAEMVHFVLDLRNKTHKGHTRGVVIISSELLFSSERHYKLSSTSCHLNPRH